MSDFSDNLCYDILIQALLFDNFLVNLQCNYDQFFWLFLNVILFTTDYFCHCLDVKHVFK